MGFPEWAPHSLVETYNDMQERAVRHLERVSSDDWDDSSNSCPACRHDPERDAIRLQERSAILARLLTHTDMEAAWKTLSRPTTSRYARADVPWMLWYWIDRALDEFERQIPYAPTPAHHRKSLLSVAAKAQSLLDAIQADSNARRMASQTPAVHLQLRNLEFRTGRGETPSAAEFTIPLTLSGDCDEARRQFDHSMDEDLKWEDLPLLRRMEYWAAEVEKMDLRDLLQLFVNLLNERAERPTEIKQPGRGDAAVRAFLIGRLDDFMRLFFEQPLSETVAVIITAVLDLREPLTRADVRPYLPRREES